MDTLPSLKQDIHTLFSSRGLLAAYRTSCQGHLTGVRMDVPMIIICERRIRSIQPIRRSGVFGGPRKALRCSFLAHYNHRVLLLPLMDFMSLDDEGLIPACWSLGLVVAMSCFLMRKPSAMVFLTIIRASGLIQNTINPWSMWSSWGVNQCFHFLAHFDMLPMLK